MQTSMLKELNYLLKDTCEFLLYYDDILLFGSFQQVLTAVRILQMSTLSINETKSVVYPTQVI